MKTLTKLKATDGGAATTIPQVCGGGWVAHSPTQRTVHLWTLPHAPLRLLRVRFAQFVFDFDAVKAQCAEDRSFALEMLVRR